MTLRTSSLDEDLKNELMLAVLGSAIRHVCRMKRPAQAVAHMCSLLMFSVISLKLSATFSSSP
jgi:hypothetical protein